MLEPSLQNQPTQTATKSDDSLDLDALAEVIDSLHQTYQSLYSPNKQVLLEFDYS